MYTYWPSVAAAMRCFKMVLFAASHRNNFVGGTCALPSALLVCYCIGLERLLHDAECDLLALAQVLIISD